LLAPLALALLLAAPPALAQDPAPATFAFTGARVSLEGEPIVVHFTATGTHPDVPYSYTLGGDTAGIAEPTGSGVLAAAASDAEISIPTARNDTPDQNRTLTFAVKYVLDGQTSTLSNGRFTLVDPIRVDIQDAAPVSEGTVAVFVVDFSGVPPVGQKVRFHTEDGEGTALHDYGALTSSTRPVAGVNRQLFSVIRIATRGDTDAHEGSEHFRVVLEPTRGFDIGRGTATATINDGPVQVPGDRCLVPKLRGLTLAKALARLALRHCKVGPVIRRRVRGLEAGKVAKSSPPAGTVIPLSTPVTVVVSRASQHK
jgi:hypothetical protein